MHIVLITKKPTLKSLSRYIFKKVPEVGGPYVIVNVKLIAPDSVGVMLMYTSVGFSLQLCVF